MFDAIVSVESLRDRLEDPRWVVVDCRHQLADFSAGRALYDAGHIPGAFFARVEDDLSGTRTGSNGRHPLPNPETFASFLRSLGVNDDTQIVAYDAGGDMFAARMWFVCRYIGHSATAVLDGGYAAWLAAGYPASRAEPARPGTGTLQADPRADLIVDVDDVLSSLESGAFTLVDARGADRFAGLNETIDPIGGHIPGARNRPFRENFDERGHFKSPDRLREEFAKVGLPRERMVQQCGSGVSAAVNALAAQIAGIGETRLYPGSWSEWCSDPSRPMTLISGGE